MPAPLHEKEILVIDDVADVRVLARRILEKDGARVEDADGVESGLQLALGRRFELIVLDLWLPGRTGFDFLAVRRETPSLLEVPVIILSGKNDKDSVTSAIALGASDYVVKPFLPDVLLKKVRHVLALP